MKQATLENEPKLAAPGAGLPWLELQVARQIFRWELRRSSRESATELLRAEKATILRLAATCDEAGRAQRVLIERIRGMEDSSRYWSIFMTLDHLRIINGVVAQTIAMLGRGETSTRKASTAAVKPDPCADGTALGLFEEACGEITRAVNEIENLHTASRYAHPWFGPLDAAGWHFMAGFHMRLHRKQIEAILSGLAEKQRVA